MESNEIFSNIVESLSGISGESLDQIILYGSYARGDYTENSDIDIMILTSLEDSEIREVENTVFDSMYDIELGYGIHISVNIKNSAHFNYWLGALPYYDNIMKEGIVLGRKKQSPQ